MLRRLFKKVRYNVWSIIIIIAFFYIAIIIISDSSKMFGYLIKIQPNHTILILLFFSAAIFLRSVRQLILLKQISINIPYRQNLIIYCAGLLMTITPGSMGQMIKSGYFYRLSHEHVAKTIPLVVAERYHDILALTCFVAILVIVLGIHVLVIPVSIIIIAVIFFTIVVKQKPILYSLGSFVSKVRIFKIAEEQKIEFNESLGLFFRKENLLKPWLISIIVSTFDALGIHACFVALNVHMGIGLTTAYGFTAVLYGAASFLPGGVGITEISFIKLLTDSGINLATATSVVILMRVCSVWYSTFIGAIATYFASKLKYMKNSKI